MSSSDINIDQALNHPGQTFKGQQLFSRKHNAGKGGNVPKEHSTAWAKAHQSWSTFRRLQAINTKLNRVAASVRVADQIMDTIGKFIAEMKAQLERIIKNYPPFPPGSEERVKILRSYNALRKQIDQIAFPIKNQEGRKPAGDPEIVLKRSDPKTQSTDNWVLQAKDLDLPDLSDLTTDQEISAAIKRLVKADETLQGNRARAAKEASGISSSMIVGTKWVDLEGDMEANEFDLSEEAAELKSKKLQRTLSTEKIKGGINPQSSVSFYIDESE
jgi:hypothetical protein